MRPEREKMGLDKSKFDLDELKGSCVPGAQKVGSSRFLSLAKTAEQLLGKNFGKRRS